MEKLLQCYSTGDRRFSALSAYLYDGDSIERKYHSAKRNKYKEQYSAPRHVNPQYLLINNQYITPTLETRHLFYTSLWHLYFMENINLFSLACEYDGFYENGPEIFYPTADVSAYFSTQTSCNQALSIAWLVSQREKREEEMFPEVIVKNIQKYWDQYHYSIK